MRFLVAELNNNELGNNIPVFWVWWPVTTAVSTLLWYLSSCQEADRIPSHYITAASHRQINIGGWYSEGEYNIPMLIHILRAFQSGFICISLCHVLLPSTLNIFAVHRGEWGLESGNTENRKIFFSAPRVLSMLIIGWCHAEGISCRRQCCQLLVLNVFHTIAIRDIRKIEL